MINPTILGRTMEQQNSEVVHTRRFGWVETRVTIKGPARDVVHFVRGRKYDSPPSSVIRAYRVSNNKEN